MKAEALIERPTQVPPWGCYPNIKSAFHRFEIFSLKAKINVFLTGASLPYNSTFFNCKVIQSINVIVKFCMSGLC